MLCLTCDLKQTNQTKQKKNPTPTNKKKAPYNIVLGGNMRCGSIRTEAMLYGSQYVQLYLI